MAAHQDSTDHFEAKMALEALRGDKTMQKIAAKRHLHPVPGIACQHVRKGEPSLHIAAAGH